MKESFAILTLLLLLASIPVKVECQDSILVVNEAAIRRQADSLRVLQLLASASEYAGNGMNDSAAASISRANRISVMSGFPESEASGYELLASLYTGEPDWEEILLNYLKAASVYNRQGMNLSEARILKTIAGKYADLGIFKKAASYYEQEFSLYPAEMKKEMAASTENAALSWYKVPDDSLSVKWYQAALHYHQSAGDNEGILRCRQRLSNLFVRLEEYNAAGSEFEILLKEYIAGTDYTNAAYTFNNIGILKFRNKDYQGALENFMLAEEYSAKGGSDPWFLTDVSSNKAVCHQTLGQTQSMLSCFSEALRYAKTANRSEEAARIAHILALINLNKEDYYHAELYCLDCIAAARSSAAPSILQECYKTYSQVLERGNDFIRALEYYEKYLSLRDSVNLENRIREQNELARMNYFEELEQRLKLDIADQEIRDLALKNLLAESARRENEVKLLVKQQQLDNSEKQRLSQSLILERERYVLNLREQEVKSLQIQQRIDSLQYKQKADEALALDRQNKLLESEKRQQEITIQKEKQIKRLALGIGILMVIVAIMILGGLISTRRKNQKLAESKRHIEMINADLEAKNTEIVRQKDIIEQKNQAITDSIQYASRIQSAVLPPLDFIDEWEMENFILYRPKDIVSGDFYWGMKKENRIILAAVDCTGHGVPGALMSMLGHSFLDEILITKKLTDAATILNLLRDEVINALRQRGMVGEARDGMDIALCILDREAGVIEFAGANNPLYLVRESKLTKLPADRMPIGIHVTSISSFTNTKAEIKPGDCLYLFSDGYADQFGGSRGKKFMYKPFQDLILRNHSEPMQIQKEILENTFIKWMGTRDQVDDVLVIGLRI
jgi:serine phosphatase RsbU (regulator of sigma subunit)